MKAMVFLAYVLMICLLSTHAKLYLVLHDYVNTGIKVMCLCRHVTLSSDSV